MKTTKTAKEKLAGLVRVISIPPVMVTALLLILYFWGPQPFCPVGELVTTILLLGFVPVTVFCQQIAWRIMDKVFGLEDQFRKKREAELAEGMQE